MSAGLAGILGALAGLGVLLIITGLRRGGTPEPSPRLTQVADRVRQEATLPRVAGTVLAAAVVAFGCTPFTDRTLTSDVL